VRIVDVAPFIVRVGERNQLLVRIETSDGLVGWGESGMSTRELAVKGAVEHFRDKLVGMDPMRRGALWQELYRGHYFEGGRVLSAAISAIDIALHDIVGKALGVPVYDLLGGRHRDHVRCFATTQGATGEQLVEDVVRLVEAGWSSVRVMALRDDPDEDEAVFEPRASIATTARWVQRAREAVGPGPMLGVEYHHRLTVAEAATFAQSLPSGTIDYLEEPIRAESPEAYATLRTMTDIPFAVGEEFSSKWAFLPFIERGLTQYARLDICNVGGFTEAMKVAGWAEAHYVDLMPHNPLGPICSAASAHLAMACPNFAYLEIRESPTEDLGFYDPATFPVQPAREGERLFLDDRPGLGIEVDESRLHEEFHPTSTPRLHRRDGALTNW
jgi:galactonate dehydratase